MTDTTTRLCMCGKPESDSVHHRPQTSEEEHAYEPAPTEAEFYGTPPAPDQGAPPELGGAAYPEPGLTLNLPDVVTGHLSLALPLDVDAMREAAPEVRKLLIDTLRAEVTAVRSGRGTVVVPEDTYPLVRRAAAAGEVLRQWASAFTAAAAEADAILEEEALTAMGSYPGVEEAPSGSLFVPDGEGQRIKVEPDWKAGESTWDLDTLKAWVAEQIVSAEGVGLDTDGEPVFTAQDALSLVRDGMDKLLSLCGKVSPAASKVEAERKRLAGLQRDSDAAVLRQVRTVGPRKYQGVKITREVGK